MIQVAAFLLLTLLILKYSWPNLKNPRSHGFFRFFAFESILGIICYNLAGWFRNPFMPAQIISWIMLILSIGVAVYSFLLIFKKGRPSGNFENTTTLVKTGIYRFIRHPLYLSLLLLSIGAFLKQADIATTSMFIASLISIYLTAKNEETENLAKFGVNYEQYIHETKMFIPFIF